MYCALRTENWATNCPIADGSMCPGVCQVIPEVPAVSVTVRLPTLMRPPTRLRCGLSSRLCPPLTRSVDFNVMR